MISFFQLKTRLVLLFLILIWLVGIFSPVLFNFEKISKVFFFINLCYSQTCHQNPDKTLVINNHHLLVCIRCLGIYSGILFCCVYSLFKAPGYFPVKYFLFSAVPMILDIIFYNYLGIYHYSKPAAFLTGILLGSSGFFLTLQGIEITLIEIFHKEKI